MTTPRLSMVAAAAGLALVAGCTGSNIAGTERGGGGDGAILFASNRFENNFELYRIGSTGGETRRLTTDRVNNDLAPAASRDGRMIAWEKEILSPGGSITSVEIWVMDASGGSQRAVVRNGSENRNPSWTRGDSALVFESRISGNSEIMRVPLAGGEPVNLTVNQFADQYPRVSPDGSRVLFHSNRDLNFDVYAMNADGSNPRNLSADPADDRFATWTPDGAGVVWSRFIESFDLYRMDAGGTSQRLLLSTPFEETNPSISPDGMFVTYQTNRFPRSSLDIASMSGTDARALTGSATRQPASDVGPWWSAPAP